MAEIGLVASVIQIASTGLKLSITLYTFAETVFVVDKSIKHIARDVSLTSAVLNELGDNFKQGKQARIASENCIKTTMDVVQECSEVFYRHWKYTAESDEEDSWWEARDDETALGLVEMTVSSAEDGTVMKRPRDTKEYPGFDTYVLTYVTKANA